MRKAPASYIQIVFSAFCGFCSSCPFVVLNSFNARSFRLFCTSDVYLVSIKVTNFSIFWDIGLKTQLFMRLIPTKTAAKTDSTTDKFISTTVEATGGVASAKIDKIFGLIFAKSDNRRQKTPRISLLKPSYQKRLWL